MALFAGIKRQLRSVIEWQQPDANCLFQQWTDNGDEIKNASAQGGCIFVYKDVAVNYMAFSWRMAN